MGLSTDTIEIMSPVGSYESLMAALQAGANSVYFGIEQLNMRARSSNNFTKEDLKRIVEICNNKGVKTYITINTVVYDDELPLMRQIVDSAKENGVSAIIASDLSVIKYAREKEIEVHLSTQCNVSNIETLKFYSTYADVIVLARELNLKQISEICNTIEKQQICGPSGNLIKIEIFIHGALCSSISGKCYLSLDNANYSANRGACLQICRRPYQVKDKDGGIELEIDNEYIMSSKDLCTIGFLDKILKAGVKVLKIEGRGRSPEYVKTVTDVYKTAVLAYQKQGNYNKQNIALWTNRLKTVFNRGFWDGYYLGRKMGEWADQYGSQATRRKEYIGKITNYFTKLGVAEIKVEAENLNTGDEIIITGPTTGVYKGIVKEIRVDLKKTTTAKKGDVCSIPINTFLRRSDKLYKLIEVPLN